MCVHACACLVYVAGELEVGGVFLCVCGMHVVFECVCVKYLPFGCTTYEILRYNIN